MSAICVRKAVSSAGRYHPRCAGLPGTEAYFEYCSKRRLTRVSHTTSCTTLGCRTNAWQDQYRGMRIHCAKSLELASFQPSRRSHHPMLHDSFQMRPKRVSQLHYFSELGRFLIEVREVAHYDLFKAMLFAVFSRKCYDFGSYLRATLKGGSATRSCATAL